MTRSQFMQEYTALDDKVLDLRVSDADAAAAIDAFEARTDISDDWKAEAVGAARGSMEMRSPHHLADKR
jgi:hypothetical protein